MNMWDTDFLLFHLNFWEALGALIGLQAVNIIYFVKGSARKKAEFEKISDLLTPDESQVFKEVEFVIMGLFQLIFGFIGMVYILVVKNSPQDGQAMIVMSTLLGAILASILCLGVSYSRFKNGRQVVLDETFGIDFLETIAETVNWKRTYLIMSDSIENNEKARLLAEGIPVVEQYESLQQRYRTFSKKAHTVKQQDLLKELENVIELKKKEVQNLFPLIYECIGRENPLELPETAWQDMEEELKKVKMSL